jgi:hypothetical protein
MKHYQDTETGLIHAFEDGIDPRTLNNRNVPATLSEVIKPKPDDSYVWYQNDWIKHEESPQVTRNPSPAFLRITPHGWLIYSHIQQFIAMTLQD